MLYRRASPVSLGVKSARQVAVSLGAIISESERSLPSVQLWRERQSPYERNWFVGDTVYDIQAGKAAGMRTCAVTYGIGLVDELEHAAPDLLLGSLEDLPARLRGG